MIKLDRSQVKAPVDWADQIRQAFPDLGLFLAKAAEFESLGIDDPVRRRGFKSFAPEVLPQLGRGGRRDFKAIWGKAKKLLAAMSHQKCAYCEHPLNARAAAAVEHFKPKSIFPSLVYDWLNYLLGCFGCNGAKLDKWPAGGTEYIRPDEGEPAAEFLFLEDGTVQPVKRGGAAEQTIRDLDLNREWLCELRRRAIQERLSDLHDLLSVPGLPDEERLRLVQRHFARLQNPELGYSEALRQCVERALAVRFPTPGL